jgi:hypothetical protein
MDKKPNNQHYQIMTHRNPGTNNWCEYHSWYSTTFLPLTIISTLLTSAAMSTSHSPSPTPSEVDCATMAATQAAHNKYTAKQEQ